MAKAIDDLIERYPLPDGVSDVVMNKQQCAEFLAVSLPTIDNYIRSGMPVKQEGTNGRSWELQASHVHAWRSADEEARKLREGEVRRAIETMRMRLVGGAAGSTIQALSPRERKELYEVEAAHEKLRRERAVSLHRDDVREAFETLMQLTRDTVTAFPDRAERELQLDGKTVDHLIDLCDDLLEDLARRIQSFFDSNPVKDDQARQDMFQ